MLAFSLTYSLLTGYNQRIVAETDLLYWCIASGLRGIESLLPPSVLLEELSNDLIALVIPIIKNKITCPRRE